jgi:hypothetical protein
MPPASDNKVCNSTDQRSIDQKSAQMKAPCLPKNVRLNTPRPRGTRKRAAWPDVLVPHARHVAMDFLQSDVSEFDCADIALNGRSAAKSPAAPHVGEDQSRPWMCSHFYFP